MFEEVGGFPQATTDPVVSLLEHPWRRGRPFYNAVNAKPNRKLVNSAILVCTNEALRNRAF